VNFKTLSLSLIAAVGMGGCEAATGPVSPPGANAVRTGSAPAAATRASYTTKWVQLVIFENESYDDIVGSPQTPYITGLAHTWANMTNSHAITHPSQPNYLALFSGSTQGVTNDNCPVNFSVASLGSELVKAGISFTGFAESMPSDGFEGCDGVLILTFDENDGSPGNQIPTILAGNVNPGKYSQKVNHYNVLRTIEDIFAVKALGKAASATPIAGVVK
jgi:hypothetical protein